MQQLKFLFIIILLAGNVKMHAQTHQVFTDIELQPTVAYINYKGHECRMIRLLFKNGKSYSDLKVNISFNGLSDSISLPADAAGIEAFEVPLPGPPIAKNTQASIEIESAEKYLASRCIVEPAKKWTVYILPHSHVDVGYTNLQSKVLKLHMNNIDEAIALAAKTQNYPEGAKYKWNTEAVWVVDNYLKNVDSTKKSLFWDAVKKGWINIDAAYGNINTSLTDSRQLMQMFHTGKQLGKEHGIDIETMFQGDVPGSSWGLAAQVNQTGIKYFLSGPNASDRIGTTANWQDKPFYWLSPSGTQKLLFWQCQPYSIGYTLKGSKIPNFFKVDEPKAFYTGHPSDNFLNPYLFQYLNKLSDESFPYDMTILTWAMSDNAPIDPELPDAVKLWNERYTSPRLVITSTKQFFADFEKKYKNEIPVLKGDYTEYWTDGVGSAAKETAINRNTSSELQQADALWAIRNKSPYPKNKFEETWKNILLFSEHTWGAYNSISEPENPKVKEEWKIKQRFALNGKKQADELLQLATQDVQAISNAIDLYNTSSWTRTELVKVPANLSTAGDLVKDIRGHKIVSQRLSTGELAFMATDIPALAKGRYTINSGKSYFKGNPVKITSNTISNDIYTVELNPQTGTIKKLLSKISGRNFVSEDSVTFNQYLYLLGDSLKNIQTSSNPVITIKENGPLVASLLVKSSAPGCNSLMQEIRLITGSDKIEIINTVDKKAVLKKEGVHFAFPFNIPKPQLRYNIPWASVLNGFDQLPNANKNWYAMQRWLDISNKEYGITISSPDAPLFEIGNVTAHLLGGLHNSPLWIKEQPTSSRIYSWVMNNHWHTNFVAFQEGVVSFRYFIKAHEKAYNAFSANLFGIENHKPLIVAKAAGKAGEKLFFSVNGHTHVFVESMKPSAAGKGVIMQLVNTSNRAENVTINSRADKTIHIWTTNILEEKLRAMPTTFSISGKDNLSVRVEE
ncbi:glycoside hydrolase family 38 C-terminal domain-containing protein [Segetibacter koreensis]|uniref:glycoside hydrolase family 38 N-terminal domain-containing protein n=1 Tax=Segetibacter koreensis TaxID=398037 RepID=UPI0003A23668|nr:glycoside hydrolase family 38 C-terminal domain-containing protein [Segetibacter koreensis]